MARYPKIGVQYDFRLPPQNRPQRSWSEVAAATLAVCQELDEIGVDGVWLTEHHFVADGYLPTPLHMAAALAVTTSRCDIGTSVLLAPLHHPVTLAEAAAVVDNLSRGRLILGLGLGYRADELAAFGVRKSQRAGRMNETLDILTQSWAAEPVHFSGTYFSLPPVDVVPKPVQDPPRLWLGARAEPSARRAGRWATGIIVGQGQDPAVRDSFFDAAREAGRPTHGLDVAQIRSVVLPELIGSEHLDDVSQGSDWRRTHYQQWFAEAGDLPQDRGVVTKPGATSVADSTLDGELAELERLAGEGVTYVIYHGTVPGVDPEIFVPQWRRLIDATR